MKRLYLRLIFNKIEKFLHLLKNYKNPYLNFIKPFLYKKKIKKVLELNKNRLLKKKEIINLNSNTKTSKVISFVR